MFCFLFDTFLSSELIVAECEKERDRRRARRLFGGRPEAQEVLVGAGGDQKHMAAETHSGFHVER